MTSVGAGSMEGRDGSSWSGPTQSFGYHSAFLPEYFTTVAISFLFNRLLSGTATWTADHAWAPVAGTLFWEWDYVYAMTRGVGWVPYGRSIVFLSMKMGISIITDHLITHKTIQQLVA